MTNKTIFNCLVYNHPKKVGGNGWIKLFSNFWIYNFFLTYTSQFKAATDSTTYLIGHKNPIHNRSFQVLFIN
ncbi:hypothetical protein GLYMA_07G248500v4 [Glycine max]|uniref:Uncharacterized protein n=2 Tax=Glycine subgen. Soja TaxID=1462606 RepID=K7L3P7_SOYBN|nr:hypothetical protein JHK85_020216 [Glycine max]KAH1088485.1 hypothetical protein GYH30_019500 [Glycine max]KRH50866.1 hypothetical protein GLYMA_07G248500v4 [Glycine max]RZC04529.1 hypothetical protein D0Y65_018911 [Glycine soja]